MSIKINRVYTRSGDGGETALVGGKRVAKSDLRVACYGDIDELNSQLGVMKAELAPYAEVLASLLTELQQQLFDLGSELATPAGESYPGMWRAEERHVLALELHCDTYGDPLPELSSFILPGGTRFAAHAHVARCVARRAERSLVVLAEAEEVNPCVLSYLNRLSDLLFILARWELNAAGAEVPLWKKEAERLAD